MKKKVIYRVNVLLLVLFVLLLVSIVIHHLLIIHIVVGLMFLAAILCHLYLHWGNKEWVCQLSNMNAKLTKLLTWVSIPTFA